MSRLGAMTMAAVLTTALGCAPRAPSRAPVYGVRGPPLLAWLEEGAAALTLTVVPTTRLGGAIAIEVRDARGQVWRGTTRGGRLEVAREPRRALEVEVSWQDPGDVAGARVVLHHPLGPETATPPTFEPIERLNLGRDGPSVEQAIRIR